FRDAADVSAEEMRRERDQYRQIILENIEYDILCQDRKLRQDDLDEIVEIMVDTVCAHKPFIRVSGEDKPAEVVKSRLLKLDSGHIQFVLDCMSENTTKVRNIRQYLLAALYNAPVTISNYYTSLVNHDMYGGGL
ncbi:MAG: helix-turn-helix domain-containing protein, partial [Oscillospiraceae bacterium]|nr:helix-turn-helix domain-containing protein [Oscillospiraceae bacterium]